MTIVSSRFRCHVDIITPVHFSVCPSMITFKYMYISMMFTIVKTNLQWIVC
jgi:hypothetical protein